MAWTYDVSLLATSDLFQVRFMIGDTDPADQLLKDEEIEFKLSMEGSVNAASVACCETLAAKYARQVDYDLGPHSIKASNLAKQFTALADRLRSNANKKLAAPLYTEPHDAIFDIDMMNSTPCQPLIDEEE